VADLCFRDEAETYAEIVEEIGSRADIFVVVLHNGDAKNGFEGTELAKKLAARKQKPDVIIAGHTHFVNDLTVDGIPIVQSGANGRMYGRVDLIFDLKSRQVDRAKTRRMAGIPIDPAACPRESLAFCSADSASGRLAYEGAWMTPDADVEQLISDARKAIAPLADRRMGRAQGPLKPDRTRESNLANALTDVLRALSGAEVAFLNTGGIRTSIDAGDVTYEEFYRVLPFNNRGVLIAPMPIEKLFVLLERSIQTCGLYGALMQSGLRVEFERDCSAPVNQTDPKARLLRVETLAGEVLLDRSQGVTPPAGRTFQVATLDFLHAGGSGFSGFVGVPLVRELGLAREAMVEYFLKTPADFSETLDGRWKELPRAPSAP
jgi:2',3'-cyclic-nucleotide 2'-phosphodiesterase (5'-nucleotidase family)